MRFEDPTTEHVEAAIAVASGFLFAVLSAFCPPAMMMAVYRHDEGRTAMAMVETMAKGLFQRNDQIAEVWQQMAGIASMWESEDLRPAFAAVMTHVEQLRAAERQEEG